MVGPQNPILMVKAPILRKELRKQLPDMPKDVSLTLMLGWKQFSSCVLQWLMGFYSVFGYWGFRVLGVFTRLRVEAKP